MITKENIIMDIIKQKPEAHNIMMEEGLHCIGCGGAAFESLEQGAKAHGLEDKQINDMLTKINDLK
jgi:hybrid cluster-associated redox disulfide protein